jgi:hypothetical protein
MRATRDPRPNTDRRSTALDGWTLECYSTLTITCRKWSQQKDSDNIRCLNGEPDTTMGQDTWSTSPPISYDPELYFASYSVLTSEMAQRPASDRGRSWVSARQLAQGGSRDDFDG